jgi:5-methylthioadenosine/S-adenosylhomocysteine deaminase
MERQSIDLLIRPRWTLPIEPEGLVLEDHALAVSDGRIVDLLPAADAAERFAPERVVDLPGHLLAPGLVNAHTHAAMTLFRGLADDLPLMTWLNRHVWPAEQRWVSEEFVRDGTRLAVAEMLRGGTTCFNDMYFYPDVAGRAAAAAGMRSVVGLIVLDFPTTWARDPDEYLAKGIAIHDHLRGEPLVHTAFSPHAPYSVSDAPLERVATLAEELDLPVHIHVHETDDEIRDSLERFGRRPLARLKDLGLVSPRLMAVHATHLQEDEVALLAGHGASVVHCPQSNLKLASGFCPVPALAAAGTNLALGSDGAASNNDLDLLAEMQTAALLAKGTSADPTALPAARALTMATLGGARALGLEGLIGSLEPGKSADLMAVDLARPETEPVYHPLSQLVYAAGREQVTDVWVAGRHVLAGGVLTTVDLEEAVAKARSWRARIAASDRPAGAEP